MVWHRRDSLVPYNLTQGNVIRRTVNNNGKPNVNKQMENIERGPLPPPSRCSERGKQRLLAAHGHAGSDRGEVDVQAEKCLRSEGREADANATTKVAAIEPYQDVAERRHTSTAL